MVIYLPVPLEYFVRNHADLDEGVVRDMRLLRWSALGSLVDENLLVSVYTAIRDAHLRASRVSNTV